MRLEKYRARPAALSNDFHHVGVRIIRNVVHKRGSRRHFRLTQGTGHRVDHLRSNQRFIALYIHYGITIAPRCHLRNPVRAAEMIGTRHLYRAKLPRHLRNTLVIRGHNDFGQTRRLAATFHHMLHQRLARDKMQRFAGKPRGRITRWNNADDVHACSKIQSAAPTTSSTTAARVTRVSSACSSSAPYPVRTRMLCFTPAFQPHSRSAVLSPTI